MRRFILILILLIITVAGVIGSRLWYVDHSPPKQLLPAEITNSISFVIYFPGSDWQTPINKVIYRNKVLTMGSSKIGTELTITEQATPDVFNDVPEYYPTLVSKLNQYSSVGSANGTAYLTKPKELNGQQQAVLNNNGTLMFVHPNKNLSDDDWRRFFNSLQIIKPS